MKPFVLVMAVLVVCGGVLFAADAPAKPVAKITPGQVIIPFDRMQRPWGELISLDLATRTGKFRRESNDEIMTFTVMPYAELLHHATHGDLQDFRVGERVIFRLHENDKGEWVWLTYIQDEMNMMNGHKEYYHVDRLNAEKGEIVCTQGSLDKSYIREQGIVINTDKDTRYWKAGQPAKFAEIQLGDKLRTKTHGIGQGKVRVAWDVFLDEESLLKFQAEQKAVHAARIKAEGAPGYVDEVQEQQLQLTMFHEGAEVTAKLKPGSKVRIAPAGVDRKPTTDPAGGVVVSAKTMGRLCKLSVKLDQPARGFQPTALARLWMAAE